MSRKTTARRVQDRLGVPVDAAWCRFDRIPKPPEEIHRGVSAGPLRPALIRPLGVLGVLVAWLLAPLVMILALLSAAEEWVERMLGSKADRARTPSKAQEAKEQKAAIAAHGLDQVFDGDWTGAAGQFLLRWYGRSSHHRRLLILAPDRLVLAAPPKRVSVREEERMRIVAEIPATEATVEDPLVGLGPSDRLRVRFGDGSWLTVITDEPRSEVHMHLMRQPRLGAAPHTQRTE
ncbi:hypothetical protein [Streptomyces sp. NPDC000851]